MTTMRVCSPVTGVARFTVVVLYDCQVLPVTGSAAVAILFASVFSSM
jgi:hypothetical protein